MVTTEEQPVYDTTKLSSTPTDYTHVKKKGTCNITFQLSTTQKLRTIKWHIIPPFAILNLVNSLDKSCSAHASSMTNLEMTTP